MRHAYLRFWSIVEKTGFITGPVNDLQKAGDKRGPITMDKSHSFAVQNLRLSTIHFEDTCLFAFISVIKQTPDDKARKTRK